MRKIRWAIFLILAAGLLSGCAYDSWGSFNKSEEITIPAGQTLGQTFKAKYDGLAGIELFPGSLLVPGAEVQFSLFAALDSEPLRRQAGADTAAFLFEPVAGSALQSYRLEIVPGEGADFSYLGGPGDVYLDGSAMIAGISVDRQVSFRLIYDVQIMLAGLLAEIAGVAGISLAIIFLFVLPGLVVLEIGWPGWEAFDFPGRFALAAGAGLALYPILFLWTHFVGLKPGPLYAWLPSLAASAYFLWTRRSGYSPRRILRMRLVSVSAWNVSWIVVIGLVVFTRYWVVRDVAGPMWGDSVQHALITQLMLDNGGLFSDWAPYTELVSFNYHFGFHTAAAALSWLLRVPSWTSVLWMGQVLNVLAVLGLYPLASRLTKNRWAGLIAVLAAGLLINQPMFYTNWGRFTQLAGQVILPVVMLMGLEYFNRPDQKDAKRLGVVFAVLMTSLLLTHYRVAVFAVLFFLLLVVLRLGKVKISALITGGVWAAGITIFLFLPWLIEILGGRVLEVFQDQIAQKSPSETTVVKNLNIIGDLDLYAPYWFWALSVASGIWALVRRRLEMVIVAAWFLLMVLAANPDWIGLPGIGSISNFAVFIAAYMPLTVLSGFGIAEAGKQIGSLVKGLDKRPAVWTAILGLVLAAGLWGAGQRIRDISAIRYGMLTAPDLRAAEWIKNHTPEDALIAVNSFTAWNDTAVVGSDGGWWLSLVAGRKITVPPLSYMLEKEPVPGYRRSVLALSTAMLENGITAPSVIDMLVERGVDFVYIGQQRGRVNWGGPVLEPDAMLASSHFEQVYAADRIRIFRFYP